MKIFTDFGLSFFAPGKVGKQIGEMERPFSNIELFSRFVLFILGPSFAISWILLYAFNGGGNFTLMLVYNAPIDIDIAIIPPLIILVALVGIIILLFWFIPVLLFFFSNIIVPANRGNMNFSIAKIFKNFMGSSMISFSYYYILSIISFWVMTSGATLFWGMRTVEDIIFTISLITCIAMQFVLLTVSSKNFFQKGTIPSIIVFAVFSTLLGGLIGLLFA